MTLRRYLPSRSLFVTSLLCFICIIVLFSLFKGLSFTFFKSKLEREIIASNRMLLEHTAERYANHFSRLETLLYNRYKSKEVQSFNRQIRMFGEADTDYLTASKISAGLRPEANDPLFYLESLIIHFGGNAFAVDQEGSSSAEDMFERAYASSTYPYPFWQDQLLTASSLTLLPAATYKHSVELPASSTLMPLVFKLPGDDYQIIALLDMDKARHAFFGDSSTQQLAILDDNGRLLYPAEGASALTAIPEFNKGQKHMLRDGKYWFRATDSKDLTYISAVPAIEITSQLRKWNVLAAALAAIMLLIGLGASILFSKKLERPVKQLIAAVTNRHADTADTVQSQIKEFTFIDRSIKELLKEREEVQAKMTKQRSILTSFGYISQLKNINEDIVEWEQFLSTNESYTVVLYELRFRSPVLGELNIRPEQASLAIREHIRLIATQHCPDSHTFQMEKNYILTVVKGSQKHETGEMLGELKEMLDLNKHYCLVTVAVSSRFEHPSQFNYAYEQVQALAKQACLLEETQLITEFREIPDMVRLTAMQEQELAAALQAGQGNEGYKLLAYMLDEMYSRGASALQYETFAEHVYAMAISLLEQQRIEASQSWSIKPIHYRLAACCTLEEYKDVLYRLMEASGELVKENKSDAAADPIIARVMAIIETQFAEELSLDYLADKLNMSGAYLSAYIKEKTGINFSEHLNSIRVAKAKELLTGTTLNINDISRQVGYHNITSFNRMFKKVTGFAPGEFRKQHVLERQTG
ncbi:helix-turn-helix domain-containing protein [Bacillus sp. FJAT-26390]|uniref:helix-turn-helix domain-containing protein n=1 Tax=Bacillus sp. FJAT-26390 TaxID=1743142 RepID=UPI000807EAF3|nr:helix-turn-helix domain-containing protein [Bacillus sp. FJAT-26390]OBZ08730.1 hypothetical protein A7975_27060 [Bacillus sp. FJAT-26390]